MGSATTPLAETTTYSIWYPPSSVYTLLGGESISPPNTVTNPDGGTTTLYLSSLCATGTASRDTCSPLIYKTLNPDSSQRELAYGWWTSSPAPPAGIPSGTLVNPYIAITEEIRPNGATRASQSAPDVNGNITNTYGYDWGTTITTNTNGLMTGVSGTQLQTSTTGYNEQSTGAVYWNPSADGTQPNLRAMTTVSVSGPVANDFFSATYSYDNATTTANLTGAQFGGISESWSYFSNGNSCRDRPSANALTTTVS